MTGADKARFGERMAKMAAVFGRTTDPETLDGYFEQLERFPIGIVEEAINQAIRRKGEMEADLFESRQMPTAPEIVREAHHLIAEAKDRRRVGCELCNWTGYRIDESNTARRCICLLAVLEGAQKNDKPAQKKTEAKPQAAHTRQPGEDDETPF